MGESQTLFARLVQDGLGPVLRREGLEGSGSTFRLKGDGVWAVLNFQRSRYSTADEVRFTVNVGVASERLRRTPHEWPEGKPPGEADCAIRERLGLMLRDRPPADYWWIVDADTDLERLSADLTGYILDLALPFLRSFRGDEDLRDYWVRRLDEETLSPPEFRELERLVTDIGPESLRRRLNDPDLRSELERRWESESAAELAAVRSLSPSRNASEQHIRTPRRRRRLTFRR